MSLFGAPPSSNANATAAPFTFGAKPAASTTTPNFLSGPSTGLFGTPVAATTAPSLTFGIGNPVAATTAPGLTLGGTSSTTTSYVPGLNLGGTPITSATTTSGLNFGSGAPTSTVPSFAAGTSTASTTAPNLTLGGGGTSTIASSATHGSLQNMDFTDFNKILNTLTDEYEDLNRHFNEDVAFLNDFDKVLRDNHGKISAANEELTEIEGETGRCATEAECIAAQLKDIDNLVSTLEKQLGINDLDDALGDVSKNSDVKRQHIMQLFLSTDAQMQHLEDDVEGLSQQVEAIAKITGPDHSSAESFEDVRQILANQMDQLIYVDKQSEDLNKKLNDIKVKL